MDSKQVMVRTYLNQPIIRCLLGYEKGLACVSTSRDGTTGKWLVDPALVYEYDDNLFQHMAVFDSSLDDEPQQLSELWDKAKPVNT